MLGTLDEFKSVVQVSVMVMETERRPAALSRKDGAAKGIETEFIEREWLTWGLATAIYAGWLALVLNHAQLPWWAIMAFGSVAVAWQMSLQHECLHGHPTNTRWVNDAVAYLPLCLWLPYSVYRESHLVHHREHQLTLPGIDPESFYVSKEAWQYLGPVSRSFLWARNSLLGRLALGPAEAAARCWIGEFRRVSGGETDRLPMIATHLLLVAAIFWFLEAVCAFPAWQYVLLVAYPGTALALHRSFAEHQAATEPAHRTAIIEGAWFWRLLYLNNTYHVVHHDHPELPWYSIPSRYRANRDHYLEKNGGYLLPGYWHLARRYFLRAKEHPSVTYN